MSTIGSLHFTAAVSSLNLTPTAYYFHMETQNHNCCKRNCTLLFLHFRGTNHIAGNHLSIGKAGVCSKEQDKKKWIQTYGEIFKSALVYL